MQKKLKLAMIALCGTTMVAAQTPIGTDDATKDGQTANVLDETAITFTEAQLGEDDDMSSNVTILNSNSNVYASEVGYLFSPMRFRYRALNQKYNDVYINGAPMNDMESGQFRYSLVGGLNQQTRNVDFALPFEDNAFTVGGIAGSNNYNFRAGSMAAGHRLTLTAANRNYTLRGMYTYASGFNSKGWAIAANVTYRWANRGYVEGTFYNALSYFFGVQKKWNNGHSLSFSTWGNPTERASQGASTDEAYWLANDRYYNPYWGYQNGHRRNSRVVNDFAPSAIMTWDWQIDDQTKLTTTLFGKYSMYKSTKLNYNDADNPQPDYYKGMPSNFYDIWNETGNTAYRSSAAYSSWCDTYNFWTASKANRQINWDRLYYANQQAAAAGKDALYYVEAKHNDNLTLTLASTLNKHFGDKKQWNLGIVLGQNGGRHYKTMDDLLGAKSFHNINTYALGSTYSAMADEVQYDLNTMGPNRMGKLVYEGDKFGYDYRLMVRRAQGWSSWTETFGALHYTVAGKLGYDNMYRRGYMRNGMAKNNSFGKSDQAHFLTGGAKFNGSLNPWQGHTLSLGLGYEHRAPQVTTAFVSPEVNNDFVQNLRNEHVFSSEFSYQYQNSWLHANFSAYYNHVTNGTEWQNFYSDNDNSFIYVSMTDVKKDYMGLELGLKFKLTSFLDLKALGTYSDAKYTDDADVTYMLSKDANMVATQVHSKGMRESGTPLTAGSVGLSFHQGGWFIDLDANYYDRIYLSYSPCTRFYNNDYTETDFYGNPLYDQAKGHGGWMLDGSIGRSIYLKHGSLSINLSVTNILNNQNIVTGGYEQSRLNVSSTGTERVYRFSHNPKKYYAFGTNGMLNIAYKF